MKRLCFFSAIMFLASCASVNTKESLMVTGKKSKPFKSEFSVSVLSDRIEKYLSYCYPNSSTTIIMNGAALGGPSYYVSRTVGASSTELTVQRPLSKGMSTLIHVVINTDGKNAGSTVVSYAYDMTHAGAFEKIEEIAHENQASCPYSLRTFKL
jgi:hypothetical protein